MPEDYFDLPPVVPDEAEPGSLDYAILEWCDERLKRGIRFVESSIGYDMISQAIDEIFAVEKKTGASYVPITSKLSKTRVNLIAKVSEDITAMLTDTRYFWKYSTHNQKYEPQMRISNKYAEAWYNKYQIGLRIGDVIRMYCVAGSAFGHLYYSRRIQDMMFECVDPRMVFPVDPTDYHSVQTAAGVILRQARTPEWALEEHGKIVLPDSGGQPGGGVLGWIQRMIDGPGERGGPLAKKSKGDTTIVGTPTFFCNTLYLHDKRVNKTKGIVRMGKWDGNQPQNPWSYEVKVGQPLYPFGRMIEWGNKVKLYDGPSPYWSGLFPVIKLTLNPWPGSWLGKAPTWDCLPISQSVNNNLRVIDDHCQQVAQPALIGDRNVSKAEMNKADTRKAGMKVRTNTSSGKGLQIVPPPPLDAVIWEVIKFGIDMIQKLGGTADPSVMAGLGQIPSDDTIDTIMKAMTPGVRLRSRILESFYTELAQMFLFGMMEFDSLTKRVAMFGPKGATPEDFDYYPRTMIPDHIPDGDPGDIAGMENSLGMDTPPNIYERAKFMLASFYTEYDPASLLNSAATQDLMKYFMLAKMGYVSVFTLLEKMGISNFAPPSLNIPSDEISRLALQQQLGIGMVANAQGRKASDQAPPSMGMNANGPTITTTQ